MGRFTCWWHCTTNEAERLLELREIVRYGRKEIIVRERSGGPGVAVTDLSIYRMQNECVYRVFRTTEDAFHTVYGAAISEYEHRSIEYPEPDRDCPVFLVVRYRKRTRPGPGGKPVREVHRCSVFQWDAATFTFDEEKAAAPKLCSARQEQ